jgi:hypothetical protein
LKKIVCDTGPLLVLREIGALELLRLAGNLCIPPAVGQELKSFRSRPEWLKVVELTPISSAATRVWELGSSLGRGEAEALALARQIDADWFLTDDAAARLIGQNEGIEVHGSLGVVLWAAAVGHLDRSGAESQLEALARSSLWISERVLLRARAALEELFVDRE